MSDSPKTLPRGRARITAVIQAAGDVIRIEDAERVLDLSRTQAAKLLSAWAKQGWLRRVGTGAYVPVPLEMFDAQQVVQDPWILVPVLFAPAYIGGRTAAEHWDLTEQIFRDIVVFTAQLVRAKTVERQGTAFTLQHVAEEMIFGTKTVWCGHTKIAVSDVHRTMLDMLDDPSVGGGVQQVADCLDAYLRRPDTVPDTLISYAERLGNGAVFKRLGFLAERHPNGAAVAAACKTRLTTGNAKLDPVMPCNRLVTRWRLWVPLSWLQGGGA